VGCSWFEMEVFRVLKTLVRHDKEGAILVTDDAPTDQVLMDPW
jgi:hypothetical protein